MFVTHGEPESAYQFAEFIKEKTSWKTSVPGYQDEVCLD